MSIKDDPIVAAVMTAFPGTVVRTRREGQMVDCNPRERESILHAGYAGGEYLDEIGKTDIASFTQREWLTFIEVVVTGFQEHLAKLLNDSAGAIDEACITTSGILA